MKVIAPSKMSWFDLSLNVYKPKLILVISLIPKMSSILKVDLLGGLIHLISSFLNWESVVTVRIETCSSFHSRMQYRKNVLPDLWVST